MQNDEPLCWIDPSCLLIMPLIQSEMLSTGFREYSLMPESIMNTHIMTALAHLYNTYYVPANSEH